MITSQTSSLGGVGLMAGAPGLSTYQLWLSQGNTGTLAQFLAGLVGTPGAAGTPGENGLSAYQVAVANGFSGSPAVWLASLMGAPGASGATGLSAYQLAVQNGYTGSEAQWLASLIGANAVNAATQALLDAKAPIASPAFTGTATIPWSRPGTGAVPRDVLSKLNSLEINLLDYVTSSMTDYAPAIRAALADAASAERAVVVIPRGSFAIGSTITAADWSNIELRGAGSSDFGHYGSQLVWAGPVGGVMVDWTSTGGVGITTGSKILGINLDCATTAAVGLKVRGLTTSNLDVSIQRFTSIGFDCDTWKAPGGVTAGTFAAGSGYTNGSYPNVPLSGPNGSGCVATVVVSSGVVTGIAITTPGTAIQVDDVLTVAAGALGSGGTGFAYTVNETNADVFPLDVSRNVIERIKADGSDPACANATCIRIGKGTRGLDTNSTIWREIELLHQSTAIGLDIHNADSNLFLFVRGDSPTAAAGTGNSIVLNGGTDPGPLGAPRSCRGNVFVQVTVNGGMHVTAGTVGDPSNQCTIYTYCQEGGAPLPVVDTGAALQYMTDGGGIVGWKFVGINCTPSLPLQVAAVDGTTLLACNEAGNQLAPRASVPTATTFAGTTYFDSVFGRYRAWNGVAWDSLGLPFGRSAVINGNFSQNQRSNASGTALGAGSYGHDRWKAGASGCTYTFAAAGADTTVTITAGSLVQAVEAGAVALASYWLSWSGTAQARVWQGTAAGTFASSPILVTGLTPGVIANLEFEGGALGLVQFEPNLGSGPSTFERRPIATELMLCQRYFQRWQKPPLRGMFGTISGSVSGAARMGASIVPPMRATPTLAVNGNLFLYNGTTSTTSNTIAATYGSASVLEVDLTMASTSGFTAGQALSVYQNGGGSMDLSAEL